MRNLDYHTSLNARQAKRYQQLSQMQRQANSDARRYSCNPGPFSNGSASEECRYIRASQHRIETALQQISRAAATPQQRYLRQVIYTDMRRLNCRSPQEVERLMKENRVVNSARKRIKQTYKKPKTVKQAALQQPIVFVPAENVTSTTDMIPVKATASVGKSPFSIPAAPAMKHTKAAEKSPPLIQEAVDYVPDPAIRRVGPPYFPAR
ncbi:hypothetical protein KHQ08_07920 [Pseudochrobactrum algeriensis]|uniref:hypothetical protein n=1 Tax=Pseudochrobactrum algeriensis TaxID=2834768 RepID=UPI001BCD541F|nr:hypothetical protein [Pseudochrobactrum algeriensis]QVQ37915.1 hypothetical protein KHQ08_07920 [Pseudochrobactrum algeriensis]QVQ41138.1 hypothetical protein KHQ07_06215 [Pseudochrobactrum algeriensis]QVQ45061.1 hypothetical protein KHQ09_08180 [Pseudochrobactrum algeriensis]